MEAIRIISMKQTLPRVEVVRHHPGRALGLSYIMCELGGLPNVACLPNVASCQLW